MTDLPKPPEIKEYSQVSPDTFAEIRESGQPAVLRELASDWPVVSAARTSDDALVSYLSDLSNGRSVSAIMAAADQRKRFFYNEDITGFNFVRGNGDFKTFLSDLLRMKDTSDPPSMAVQSALIADIMPRFAEENRIALLPRGNPRIWIGNRAQVATHYDLKENIAICVAGRRQFTVFPPDEIANLYPGPFELTPAGTPVSMVNANDPELDEYPNFSKAWSNAQQTALEPGDAIYIPYCWWHGVDALDPVSCLVNYWWNDAPETLSTPYDALLHCLGTFRNLPADQRAVWRDWLDFYVFERDGEPAEHLPERAKGILAPTNAQLFARMRSILRDVFARP